MIGRFCNFLATQGIVSQIDSYIFSSTFPINWYQTGLCPSTNDYYLIIQRDILSDGTNTSRYAEKIKFNANSGKFAVLIGYKSVFDSFAKIDKTNYLISESLSNAGYDGYYLFNMYPDLIPQNINHNVYPRYIDKVLDFLIMDSAISMDDIFIFWGSSVYVTVSAKKSLICLQKKGRRIFTIGTHSIPHKHPQVIDSTNTISYSIANLSNISRYKGYL